MTLLCYALVLFGFAYIVGHSKISQPIRQWISDWSEGCFLCERCGFVPSRRWQSLKDHICECGIQRSGEMMLRLGHPRLVWLVLLLECPACLATWVGLLLGLGCPVFVYKVVPELIDLSGVLLAIVFSLLSAGINTLLGYQTGLMRSEP